MSTEKNELNESIHSSTRRKLIKSAAWSAPVVATVALPQHAQATMMDPDTTEAPPEEIPTCTVEFPTGGTTTDFEVPAGITEVSIVLAGAVGGQGGAKGTEANAPGGKGAIIEGTLAVNPGDILTIETGAMGNPGSDNPTGSATMTGGSLTGGYGAGGPGAGDISGTLSSAAGGGSGGGGSGIKLNGTNVAVAGGGGGGGGGSSASSAGGDFETAGSSGSDGAAPGEPGAAGQAGDGGAGGANGQNGGAIGQSGPGNGVVGGTATPIDSSQPGYPNYTVNGGGGGGGGGGWGGGGAGGTAYGDENLGGYGAGGGGGGNLIPAGGSVTGSNSDAGYASVSWKSETCE